MTMGVWYSFFKYSRTRQPAWLTDLGSPLNTWIPIANTTLANANHQAQIDAGLAGNAQRQADFGVPHEIMSYSSGCLRAQDSCLMIQGGGGSSWGGDDVRCLYLQDDIPANWPTIVNPTNATNHYAATVQADRNQSQLSGYLKDGVTPNSGHTNNQLAFINRLNMLIRFGNGQTHPTDTGMWSQVDSVDFNNGAFWNPKNTNPNVPSIDVNNQVPQIAKDIGERLWLFGMLNGSVYRFMPDNASQLPGNATRPSGQFSYAFPQLGSHSYGKPVANDNSIFYIDQAGQKFYLYSTGSVLTSGYAFGTSAQITMTYSPGCAVDWANGGGSRGGCVWDPGVRKFWFYQNDGNLYSFTQTANFPAPAFRMDLVLAGGPVSTYSSGAPNIYGRMQYVPNLRGVVLVVGPDVNAYFVKTAAG